MSARESRMSPSRDGSYFVSRVLPEAFWSICRTWLRETAWPVPTLKVRPEALGASQARVLASTAYPNKGSHRVCPPCPKRTGELSPGKLRENERGLPSKEELGPCA